MHTFQICDSAQKYIKVPLHIRIINQIKLETSDMKKMKSEEEVRKKLERLEKERKTEGPFTEQKNIARKAAKQALEWVLEETDSVLTY
jgi:L-fucose isomerase-like protein